ncbi:E3 ubiquitin-protein ligase EL5-like [Panicum miliaceum]|uniref:RING-type E3 ubiquitin transferase n=1 Tax=Panicum miliaceum TaxID=4540 RepID=A0A3L6RQ43_PANMI|nr:E3 ubiquitin-protein ligase EL5-like [Panicum miliaceum]
MDCNPAAVACISAIWITLAAWAVHNLLAESPEAAPANVAFDALVVLAAAASRLLLVMCRPSLPVDTGGAAPGGCRPRLAGYRGASSARATDPAAAGDNQAVRPHEHGDAAVQCVVCLGEVGGGETGKRLPACRHLFHQECIDEWLHGHSTCPVCRCGVLASSPGQMVRVDDLLNSATTF